jgi:hypothetical protein
MIYVDQLKPCTPTRDWPHAGYCKLLADSLDELHDFAVKKLGLKREYFQNSSKLPHYDLTVGNHYKALKLGAKLIDDKEVAAMMKAPYQYACSH